MVFEIRTPCSERFPGGRIVMACLFLPIDISHNSPSRPQLSPSWGRFLLGRRKRPPTEAALLHEEKAGATAAQDDKLDYRKPEEQHVPTHGPPITIPASNQHCIKSKIAVRA